MVRRSVAWALLALPLLANLASAQLPPLPLPIPGQEDTVGVSVAFHDAEGRVSVESPKAFALTVRNTGTASGTPADGQNVGKVVLSIVAPQGWTAHARPESFELAPGEVREVQVDVAVSADARRSGQVVVTAVLTSPLVAFDPVLGQVPGGNQTATSSDALAVRRADAPSRTILEAIGDWIWAVLFALVASIVLAVTLAAQGRRPAVALELPEKQALVAPGGRTSLPLVARNLTGEPDTVVFQVSSVPAGWAAFLPVADLTLPPKGAQELALVIIAPPDAQHGERQSILVTAATPKSKRPATAAAEAVVGVPADARRRK